MQQRLELESTCFFCEPRNGSQITEVLSKSTHQTLSICFLHCTCLQLRQIWHNESAVGWQACALQSSHSSLPTRRPSIPDALHLQKPGHNLTQAPMYSDSRTLMVHVPSHLRTGQLVVPASVRTKSSQHEESKKSIVNTPVPRRFRVEDSGGKGLSPTHVDVPDVEFVKSSVVELSDAVPSLFFHRSNSSWIFWQPNFLAPFHAPMLSKTRVIWDFHKKAELEEVQTKQICQNSSKMNVRDIKSFQRPLYRMTNPSMIQEFSEHTFFLLWRRILYWEKKAKNWRAILGDFHKLNGG